ncbi:hypothetical protein ONZ45_g13826 [Pleurotus djamor]|nr:hypothetical protein ONZ45_g13826 [Pleurotus djamor]
MDPDNSGRFFTPRSPYLMPELGEKGAPPKFTGDYDKVKSFIKKFNKLCDAYNLTDDKEKSDWKKLEEDILRYFDAALKDTRYIRGHLDALVKKWRKQFIKNLTQWKQYEREFFTIAGWLKRKKRITADEEAQYFWIGLNNSLREKIELRIMARHPNLTPKTLFPMETVSEVAGQLFERDRWDYALANRDELPEFFSAQDSSSSSEPESSDSDTTRRKKKRKARKPLKKKKRTVTFREPESESESDSDDEKPFRRTSSAGQSLPKASSSGSPRETDSKTTDDVEGLIKQLGRLSISDPDYHALRYRITRLDPQAADIVAALWEQAKGEQKRKASSSPIQGSTQTGPRMTLPPRSKAPDQGRCFGCGEPDHSIRYCSEITNLLQQGTLKRDMSGKLVWADGSHIRINREAGEYILQAVQRAQNTFSQPSLNANFISFDIDELDFPSEEESDEDEPHKFRSFELYIDSMSESDLEYPEDEAEVFAAERTVKRSTMSREEVMDAFKKRPEVELPAGRPRYPNTERSVPKAVKDSTQESQKNRSNAPPKLVPYDARAPLNMTPGDIEMRDESTRSVKVGPPTSKKPTSRSSPPKAPNPLEPKSSPPPRPRFQPRQSELTSQMDEGKILGRLLETPVQLTMKEALGTSRGMSDALMELLKRKLTKPTDENSQPNKTYYVDGLHLGLKDIDIEHGPLIRIPVSYKGHHIEAIIDSGSQLNVMKKEIYDTYINWPVEAGPKVVMNDANGGQGTLEGIVRHVPLTCGSLTTHANIFLGVDVPFQLLLGRPWQRANRVSIEEQNEGTYLVFRPSENRRLELKVLEASGKNTAQQESVFYQEAPPKNRNKTTYMFTMSPGIEDCSSLTQLPVTCGGTSLDAIVDTGSQVNLMSEKVRHKLGLETVFAKSSLTVQGSNGKSTRLERIVRHLRLRCGGTDTLANVFVSEDTPYDLILGRPWQRMNRVSMKESLEGTYLEITANPENLVYPQPLPDSMCDEFGSALKDPSEVGGVVACLITSSTEARQVDAVGGATETRQQQMEEETDTEIGSASVLSPNSIASAKTSAPSPEGENASSHIFPTLSAAIDYFLHDTERVKIWHAIESKLQELMYRSVEDQEDELWSYLWFSTSQERDQIVQYLQPPGFLLIPPTLLATTALATSATIRKFITASPKVQELKHLPTFLPIPVQLLACPDRRIVLRVPHTLNDIANNRLVRDFMLSEARALPVETYRLERIKDSKVVQRQTEENTQETTRVSQVSLLEVSGAKIQSLDNPRADDASPSLVPFPSDLATSPPDPAARTYPRHLDFTVYASLPSPLGQGDTCSDENELALSLQNDVWQIRTPFLAIHYLSASAERYKS